MSVIERQKPKVTTEDEFEIRLSDIIQFLKDSRRTVLIWTVGMFLIGMVYALVQPDRFTASIRVMPEAQGGNTSGVGNLQSLAGLAGINLNPAGAGADAIRPDLYPDVLASIPFAMHMLKQPVYVPETSRTMTLQQYFSWQGQQTVMGKINAAISGIFPSEPTPAPKAGIQQNRTSVLAMTPEQEGLTSAVIGSVSTNVDKKNGIMTISATMGDPVVAGTVARLTQEYLTKYVTEYRTGKARNQVRFLEQQVRNARRRYQNAEYALAAYRDRNRSNYLNTAKIEEQRLQADYLLAQSVYNDLSKQLEQARIKVQEEAPVFQTLDPPRVPLHKSGPKRTIISIGFAIFGAVLGLSIYFVRRFIFTKSNRIA
ncbi:lipopolysaccharide biosynthesis protein [Fibrisoma montanum]|uniref:Lipopolysaccharide biosynthesis protein n=1 Tax=Fibrisoma montanum TaxID=2305895 RepID=A0A418M8F9_9BACT|nr:Wzz/FepE/Etk N-terminal domain-containing protein [Fibrisoma montanum]RIV22374.1 lipopolysaccharide biosynthesis protein [Fibrisoma montanum]